MTIFKRSTYLTILLLLFTTLKVSAVERVTPSEVFSEARALENAISTFSKKEINRLNSMKLFDAKPLHVYAIATALNEKVGVLMDIEGLSDIKRHAFPNEDTQPKNVLQLIKVIQHNIQKLRPETQFERIIVHGKSPRDVLRVLIRTNLLIDNLVDKKFSPKYLYTMVQQLKKNLIHAIVQSGRRLPKSDYALFSNVESKDLFVNAENMFKTLMNTTRLKFDQDYPERPYYSPYDKSEIRPYHVYTITVMNIVLLKDLIRRYDIPQYNNEKLTISSVVSPAHIYAEYEKILYMMYFFNMKN